MPCTACCDGWVSMTINGVDVFPGSPCPYSENHRCNIYDDRPVDPCVNFNCGWIVEDSVLPDWFRPDLAKVIVIPDMFVWRGLPVDMATPVGRKIPGRALNWLKHAAEQRGRPLIWFEHVDALDGRKHTPLMLVHGPAAFQEDMSRLLEDGGSLWPG